MNFFEDIIRQAEEATGKTKAELLAMADELPPELPKPKVDRETLKGRRVPEVHIRNVFDREPVQCEALTAVAAFIASETRFLVLSGGVGTRKSGSAAYALTQRSGCFIRASELKDVNTKDDEDSRALRKRMRTCSLLILDDAGTEYESERGFTTSLIQTLINDRYEECGKTVITCNLTAKDFKAKYGERTADRIRESGRFVVIGGNSVRGK